MDDQRSLRIVFSAPRGRRSLGVHVLRGSLSGLVVMGSVLVYDTFTRPAPTIAPLRIASADADAAAPVEKTKASIEAPVETADAFPFVAQVEPEADPIALAGGEKLLMAAVAEIPVAPAAQPEQAATDDAGAVVAAMPKDEIVDPPRFEFGEAEDFYVVRSVSTTPAEMAAAEEPQAPKAASRAGLTAPVQVASLVAVEPSRPAVLSSQLDVKTDIGVIDAAMLESPPNPASPSAFDSPAQPILDGERALIRAEVSLSSTGIFDRSLETGADYAALISPRLDAPATRDINVDPTASFAEPQDALSSAPHARTPDLKAPAVVAVLGAEPPAGFYDVNQPGELDLAYQNDAGRAAARRAVAVEGGEGWRRFAVTPPANPQNLPVMAIVIDEIGAYGAPVEDVVALSPMVSTSVIPSTPDSALIVDQLRNSGREVLVHMPMETYADFKEGPRPILRKMEDQEVRETARWHLSQFDGYVGVNNHLGSKVTRDQRVMGALMAELSQRDLMFLDSRTTGKSVAESVARDAGMLATRNHRFIDNEISVEAIMRELNAAALMARRYGAAVALGNPNPATVRAVARWMEIHDGKDILIAPITHVASVLNADSDRTVAGK